MQIRFWEAQFLLFQMTAIRKNLRHERGALKAKLYTPGTQLCAVPSKNMAKTLRSLASLSVSGVRSSMAGVKEINHDPYPSTYWAQSNSATTVPGVPYTTEAYCLRNTPDETQNQAIEHLSSFAVEKTSLSFYVIIFCIRNGIPFDLQTKPMKECMADNSFYTFIPKILCIFYLCNIL